MIFDKIYPQHIRMVSKFALMVVSPNSKNGEEDHTVNHMGKWADVSGYKSGKWEVGRCLSGYKLFGSNYK